MELRDKNGLTEAEYLQRYDGSKYPRPSLTADICIFVLDRRGRPEKVLLIRRGGHPYLGYWALPGGFAEPDETIEETAARELREETSVRGIPLHLVGIYSRPGRDPRGWVVSAAFAAGIGESDVDVKAGDDACEAQWFRILPGDPLILTARDITLKPGQGQSLAFDHDEILHDALRLFTE